MKQIVKEYGDWIWRALVLASIGGMWLSRSQALEKSLTDMARDAEATRQMAYEIRTSVAVIIRQQEIDTQRIKEVATELVEHKNKTEKP